MFMLRTVCVVAERYVTRDMFNRGVICDVDEWVKDGAMHTSPLSVLMPTVYWPLD